MRSLKQAIVFLLILLAAPGSSRQPAAQECRDSVVIDGVAYNVTSRWCGRRIDTAQLADPAKLVPLPQHLSFQDWNIYVLPQVREALVKMAAEAAKDSIEIVVSSGFRSVGYQRQVIKRRLDQGQDINAVFRYVAPPGYSEHHTGRALDLSPKGTHFSESDTYRWLRENAGKFGFVESIPRNSPNGEDWEPWHWYYDGDL